ncbi:MAG: YggS family pyridoxal phosphate-dependent enzyme [Chloroflexota bacterium]|nr:YggS family pyridoxal phosphate-dependent enzyme [Chloroflexota bacterium]
MSSHAALERRVGDIRDAVADAAMAADQALDSITLIAVSKTFPREDVDAAYHAGLRHFGENRVQEAMAKFEQPLPDDAVLHLVGNLQSNKAKHAPGLFSTVDSVDRVSIVRALDMAASGREATLDVLIQVNVAGEVQKAGCRPDEALEILQAVEHSSSLTARGLMTIAPIDATGDALRQVFRDLRQLRDQLLQEAPRCDLPELSMGMSGDFHDAIAEGATQIRLGRALFGDR